MNNNLPQHVFLFILDAVRKDHLGLHGYQRETSPNIDNLAKKSDVYEWAFSPSTYTLPSIPSMLSGKYPPELSTLFTGTELTNEDLKLIQDLKLAGYETAFFTANVVTSSKMMNLDDFFDVFHDELTTSEVNRKNMFYERVETVLSAVENYVKENISKKLFIVIHLMEAHGPYIPDRKPRFIGDKLYNAEKRQITRVVNDSLVGVTQELLKTERITCRYQLLNLVESPNGDIEDYDRRVNEYIARYDTGIYILDKNLGSFFKFLRIHKIFDSSQIMITSDHGELMGEENIFFSHGITPHPALSNVPLVVKKPGQRKARTIEENFSTINLIALVIDVENKNNHVCSVHPKGIGVARDKHYIHFHNGDYHAFGRLRENILPTVNFSVNDIFENFTKMKIDPIVGIYKKSEGRLVNVKNLSKDMTVLNDYLEFIRQIYQRLQTNYLSTQSQIAKLQSENKTLKKRLVKFHDKPKQTSKSTKLYLKIIKKLQKVFTFFITFTLIFPLDLFN